MPAGVLGQLAPVAVLGITIGSSRLRRPRTDVYSQPADQDSLEWCANMHIWFPARVLIRRISRAPWVRLSDMPYALAFVRVRCARVRATSPPGERLDPFCRGCIFDTRTPKCLGSQPGMLLASSPSPRR
jgi:hypothetical protein